MWSSVNNLPKNYSLNDGRALMAILKRAIPNTVFPGELFSPGKIRTVLADWDYEEHKGWVCGAGLAWARRQLAKAHEPLLAFGFDEKHHVTLRKEGSLLKNAGIGYVRLPASLENIRGQIDSLRSIQIIKLDPDTESQNIADFQSALRSGFGHGPLASLQRNFEGAFTNFKNNKLDSAIEKLDLCLVRCRDAQDSLLVIKGSFSLNGVPLRYLVNIENSLKTIISHLRNLLDGLKRASLKTAPYWDKINIKLRKLENLVNLAEPKK